MRLGTFPIDRCGQFVLGNGDVMSGTITGSISYPMNNLNVRFLLIVPCIRIDVLWFIAKHINRLLEGPPARRVAERAGGYSVVVAFHGLATLPGASCRFVLSAVISRHTVT